MQSNVLARDGLSIGPVHEDNGSPAPIAGKDSLVQWDREFFPAIDWTIAPDGAVCSRYPQWFVLRYYTGSERLIGSLLDLIKLPWHSFTFQHRPPRQRAMVTRCWLPGYVFVNFDPDRDYWQQINRIPKTLGILGGPDPLPDGMMKDLLGRLPSRVDKAMPFAAIAPGSLVKLQKGPLEGWECRVTWSDRKSVKVIAMMFGRPTEMQIPVADVRVVG